ncbi:MAG: hypothetical protein JWN34_2215 [Bryobacterales bacterium]|jgi:hypothetical protein|nr:hypothetical protein [Bryobacterales bacterium]
MKRRFVIGMSLSAVALFAQGPGGFGRGGGGGRGMGIFGGSNAYVTGAPFSAVEVVQTQEALTDGNTITRKYQTSITRDGQGRLRTEQTVTPPPGSAAQPHTIVTILDYPGQSRYVLDSSTMTAFQAPLRIPTAGAAPRGPFGGGTTRPNAPTVTTTTQPPQVVNGVLASGTLVVQTIAAGQIGNDKPIQISRQTWVSNDLKVPVQIRSSDPRFGTTVMDLTNIVQAEPNGSLFVVPAGYTVKQGRGGPGFGPGGAAALGGRQRRGPGGPQ